jgi:hypothetical protein
VPRTAVTSILWTEASALTADTRPQLVFIGDFSRSDDLALEANVFGAARMQLAARVFRHVRVSPADAARDAKLAGYRADTPVLLIVTPDATRAFALKGAELTAVEAIDKMTTVTANVSTDDLPTIVATAERTQVAIAAVDDELRTIARTPMADADRRAAYAAATARRDALVTEFRSHFVLHARTLART